MWWVMVLILLGVPLIATAIYWLIALIICAGGYIEDFFLDLKEKSERKQMKKGRDYTAGMGDKNLLI